MFTSTLIVKTHIILHTAVFKSVPHRDPKQARLGITVFTELSDMSNPLTTKGGESRGTTQVISARQ
jgi:hypothetical protein